MEPSEQVNLPMWQGQPGHFEIWFVVAIDLEAPRATWVRYTTFSPFDGPPRAAVWAADFDARRTPPTIWAKSTHAIDAYAATTDHFSVRIGPSEIRHGSCNGEVASAGHRIAWDLKFAVGSAPVRRTPAVLEQLRLGSTEVHACVDAPASGWVETDGVRRQLGNGKAVQMHLYGTRRVDNLSWIWAPALDDGKATLEVVAAQMKRSVAGLPGPHMTSVYLRHGDELEDLTQLPDALLPTTSSPAPGVLEVAWTGVRRALRIRGFAPPESYAGWVYRNTGGHELHVAQSDIASCIVESFRRSHPLGKWRPESRLVSVQRAAVELHGYAPIEGVRYVGWDESEPVPGPAVPRLWHRAPQLPGPGAEAGELVPLPPPRALVAARLTYRSHLAELGLPEPEAPQMFVAAAASWSPEASHCRLPSFRALCAAAEAVEPGLGSTLRTRFPALPVLLDYEVELGLAVLEPATREALAAGSLPRLGWFVANALTARALQVLGEGRPDPAPYAAAAQGFPGFLPALATAWVPATPRDAAPAVTLRTSVNGQPRQEASAGDLIFRPSQLLAAAAAALGRDLQVGDVVLTGSPGGGALRPSRWKRRLGRMLDRFSKLEGALQRYVAGDGFLRAGDRVTVEAEHLGARTVEIAIEAAD
jgi:2-keto-4-pentenoate hydratase/2-oxohepta-3-ene-1,7-dioic acid hydratase in catechol pathway